MAQTASLQIPPQFRHKKIYSFPYPITGAQNAASPVAVPIELTKYIQTDYISRLIVRITGNVIIVNAADGTATTTGRDNPEALLTSAMLQTTPALNGITPVNNISPRGILVDGTFMRGYTTKVNTIWAAATPGFIAVAGTTFAQIQTAGTAGLEPLTLTRPIDVFYELYFKRPYVRKGAEYDFAIGSYSSALLTLLFGGREQLFSAGAGTSTWDLSGLNVALYVDSDLNSQANRVHNCEFFERTYPILATQTDFPIDTLPQGFLYSDLIFIGEVNNVRNNTVLQNVDLEGGGRVWLSMGDSNAPYMQNMLAKYRGVISDPSYDMTGIYPLPLRDGMFPKAIDSLSSPLTIKLTVTSQAGAVIRLIGRRMVPGEVGKSNPNTHG